MKQIKFRNKVPKENKKRRKKEARNGGRGKEKQT